MASQDWFDKDFYAVLGVSKDVTDADLKKTYRKLARQHHPDSNAGDAQAEARFKEISEAYSVLSDAGMRAEYDQMRAMGSGARFTAGGAGAQGFDDIFRGFGRGAQRNQSDFDDILGDTVELQAASGKPLKVRIPAGVADGQKIRLKGKGEPSPDGGEAGDLVLAVSVRPHPVFERDGLNLRVDVPVTFVEATLGATIEVPTLDGGPVKLKVAPGTPSGRVLRVKGRGVVTGKGTGDLLATVQVAVPSHLPGDAREKLEAFAASMPDENPRLDLLSKAR